MKPLTNRVLALMVPLVIWAVPAAGDSWNDRTTLSFSEPVMVPGATLQPGTYVFALVNSSSNRHLVQIRSQEGSKVMATTQAVPMKRQEAKGDVVLKLNPTEPGTPPALRAWFYPGSLYGHEFVYPEEQARQIAQRTKTLVLSIDQPGTDMEKGTLRTYGPTGEKLDWHGDAATMREWNEFHNSGSATAANATREERREATAPAVQTAFKGQRVTVDQLEENAQRYTGKQVSVDAEVESVLGPRLFTIDEPQWGDLEGEILVQVPTVLAALVREDDRVTVSGTVKPFVRAEIEREWGWFGLADPEVEVRLAKRPVLVADRVVGGNSDFAMVINADAGSSAGPAGGRGEQITDTAMLAKGTTDLVGRPVLLQDATISGTAPDRGFFVGDGQGKVFVLPSATKDARPQKGEIVTVRGVVLQMPQDMDQRLKTEGEFNDGIYVLATSVDKGAQSSN